MTWVVSLVALLMALAGVIAWAGDRLGTWAGRKRLTLFGARPRRTGQWIGVMAGMVIMLTTLGVLALAFQGATRILLDAQATNDELTRLRDQVAAQQGEVQRLDAAAAEAIADAASARRTAQETEARAAEVQASLTASNARLEVLQTELLIAEAQVQDADVAVTVARSDLAAAEAARDAARNELAAVTAARDEALQELEGLVAERDLAISERNAAQGAETIARERIVQLQAAIEALEARGATLDEEAEALRSANEALAARNDALVVASADLTQRNERLETLNADLERRILEASDRATQLAGQVDELTARLEQASRRLSDVQQEFDRVSSGNVTYRTGELIYAAAIEGVGEIEVREALAAFVRDANGVTSRRGAGEVVLRSDQVAILVAALSQTPGSDLVRLISPRNQFSPVQVEVQVEAFDNDLVLQAGRLLVVHRVHLGSSDVPLSQADLGAELATMKAGAIVALRRAGLDEFQVPRYPTSSDETFAGQLVRRTGPVTLGIVVLDDVYRSGPATLELVVLD